VSQSIEALVATYGYPVIAAGALAEGETVLVIGGFLAHRGYLSLPLVLLVGFTSTYGLDQLFFHVGRGRGRALLARHPRWSARAERVGELLRRRGTAFLVGFRYLYGLRTVSPLVIGASSVGPLRFALLNFVGAAAWTITFGVGGYLFGAALERLLGDIRRYEIEAAAALALAGLAVWVVRLVRRRRAGR